MRHGDHTLIVHRGHSSYADLTIAQIPGTVLVFLGSCGVQPTEAILRQAPEAHVIATKGIGGITVNDPLLKALNDYLLSGKDVIWTDFWRHARLCWRAIPGLPTMCHRTASVVFLKAYRTLTGDHQPAPPPPEPHVSLRAMQLPCMVQQG